MFSTVQLCLIFFFSLVNYTGDEIFLRSYALQSRLLCSVIIDLLCTWRDRCAGNCATGPGASQSVLSAQEKKNNIYFMFQINTKNCKIVKNALKRQAQMHGIEGGSDPSREIFSDQGSSTQRTENTHPEVGGWEAVRCGHVGGGGGVGIVGIDVG